MNATQTLCGNSFDNSRLTAFQKSNPEVRGSFPSLRSILLVGQRLA
jgi:hypothetical protein